LKNLNVFKIKIAGQAGQGIKSAGLILSKFVTRSGFNTYNYTEYPSLIRGGHNVMHINICKDEVAGPSIYTDLLIALNQESIFKHRDTLSKNSFVIYDKDSKMKTDLLPEYVKVLPVPLSKIALDSGGDSLLSNVVALGVATFLLDGDIKIFEDLIKEEYKKYPEILKSDLIAIEMGYNYAKENFIEVATGFYKLEKSQNNIENKMVLNGNESITIAAITAGMQFASIYPMTPITNILHNLAKFQNDYKYVYMQPEDEISAINLAIGASFAGVRAMTATSGGGFCLMAEGYGLAGMTEIPLVIIEGMRTGPATGLPTWSSQADLQFILHAHQDEFPRLVLAAGDVKEAFYLTMEAFYLADKYQTPVVVLVDKNICEHEQSLPFLNFEEYRIDRGKLQKEFDPEFKRYLLSTNGISARSMPGVGNFFVANSDEHDENGYSSENHENRIKQMEKRMTKLETCKKQNMPEPVLYGPKNADLTIISWGSNKGSILQALNEFENVNFLHLTWMNPFPVEAVLKVLKSAQKVVLVECNYTGQLGQVIAQHTGIIIEDKVLKYDGRPFFVEEVINIIKTRLSNKSIINNKNNKNDGGTK